MKPTAFPKAEHLCGEIRINKLFSEGKAFIVYPLRIVYNASILERPEPVRLLISVPKKRFKRAVKRNRIKRLLRETYRLNKLSFVEILKQNNVQMDVAFTYLSDAMPNYEELDRKMIVVLEKLSTSKCLKNNIINAIVDEG